MSLPHAQATLQWSDINANQELCDSAGGVVSGNYVAPPSNGTDRHTDDKLNFRENEAAIDYSASFLCALSAYADMPFGALSLSLPGIAKYVSTSGFALLIRSAPLLLTVL